MMPKLTLQQRLVDALIASGRGTLVESRSRKYVTLKRPDGGFYFVGKAGALPGLFSSDGMRDGYS